MGGSAASKLLEYAKNVVDIDSVQEQYDTQFMDQNTGGDPNGNAENNFEVPSSESMENQYIDTEFCKIVSLNGPVYEREFEGDTYYMILKDSHIGLFAEMFISAMKAESHLVDSVIQQSNILQSSHEAFMSLITDGEFMSKLNFGNQRGNNNAKYDASTIVSNNENMTLQPNNLEEGITFGSELESRTSEIVRRRNVGNQDESDSNYNIQDVADVNMMNEQSILEFNENISNNIMYNMSELIGMIDRKFIVTTSKDFVTIYKMYRTFFNLDTLIIGRLLDKRAGLFGDSNEEISFKVKVDNSTRTRLASMVATQRKLDACLDMMRNLKDDVDQKLNTIKYGEFDDQISNTQEDINDINNSNTKDKPNNKGRISNIVASITKSLNTVDPSTTQNMYRTFDSISMLEDIKSQLDGLCESINGYESGTKQDVLSMVNTNFADNTNTDTENSTVNNNNTKRSANNTQ